MVKSIFDQEDEEALVEEYNMECLDLWSQLLNDEEGVLDTLKLIDEQNGLLGTMEQQNNIYHNLITIVDVVETLFSNRLKAYSYDERGFNILKELLNIGENLLKKYSKFINDKKDIRTTVKDLVQIIKKYFAERESDDYYRKITGSYDLPWKVSFDGGGVPKKEEEKNSKVLAECAVLNSEAKRLSDELKGKTTETLSMVDLNKKLDDSVEQILKDHFYRKIRVDVLSKILGGE